MDRTKDENGIPWIRAESFPVYLVLHTKNKQGLVLTKMYRAIEALRPLPE